MTRSARRRASAAPTIADVAKAAGVSPMTVSRVINRDVNVRASNHDRVTAAIRALNYSPNSAARALAGASQTRLALLYGNPSAGYLSEVLLGALEEATSTDVQILLERVSGLSTQAIVRKLSKLKLNGVILPPPFCDSTDLVTALKRTRLPLAMIASAAPAQGVSSVNINDWEAAREMTAHLIGLGHRRIGFIAGNSDQTASAARLEGYKAGLRDANIRPNPKLIAKGDFTFRSGLDAARRLLSADPRPTAIFASNDDMAAAVVSAAHLYHLDVPKDLSVCGFDDTTLASTISPELTTIRQPVAAMASAAVAMLARAHKVRRHGAATRTEQIVFAHAFIRRASDAPPRD